jgi:hypothetical protein
MRSRSLCREQLSSRRNTDSVEIWTMNQVVDRISDLVSNRHFRTGYRSIN